MAIEITSDAKPQVEIIFYVKEDSNSPYQGRLLYTVDEHAKLSEKDVEAAQVAQFDAWKANNAVLQAQAAIEPSVDDKAQQVVDLQAQQDSLQQQIDALQSDPAVQDKLTEISIASKADVKVGL